MTSLIINSCIISVAELNEILDNHVSKKEKNIYTIDLDASAPAAMYSEREFTPLVVESINGEEIIHEDSRLIRYALKFPNPCANRMVAEQHLLAEALGPQISTRIFEYLDKKTGKPVVQVYPDSVHIFEGYEKDYLSHLSHAMRRDLNQRISLRNYKIDKFIDKFIAKQNQNQK